jgi:hypothetical protein
MSGGKMVELILGLLVEVGKYVNNREVTKHIDELADLRKELIDERAKGQLSDDGKIERLIKQIEVSAQAAQQTLAAVGKS